MNKRKPQREWVYKPYSGKKKPHIKNGKRVPNVVTETAPPEVKADPPLLARSMGDLGKAEPNFEQRALDAGDEVLGPLLGKRTDMDKAADVAA